jgi:hypothetical protein
VNGQGGYGAYTESEYYWLGGHRYCWYDGGWHGGGWYWCGENFHRGIGWGGPIGWHFWFHHGHRFFPHPVIFHGPHGGPGHPHGPHGPGGPGGPGKHGGPPPGGPGHGPGPAGAGAAHTRFVPRGGGGGPIHTPFTAHTGGGGGGHPGGGGGGHPGGGGGGHPGGGGGGHPGGGGGGHPGGGGGGHPGGGGGGHPGGGGGGGGKHRSDIRLKQDIVPLAQLDNGIALYRFRYKGSDQTTYVGVMAQEVQDIVPSAVSRGRDGYLLVDYDRLGLKFMTWDAWTQRHGATTAPAP